MKAYQFAEKGPVANVLKLVEVPKPKPGPNESLVRIVAATINPADVKNVLGFFPQTTLPRIPGRDFAGVVEGGEHDGLEVWGTGGDHGWLKDGAQAE
jgi:NADPH:quinone reductase